MTIRHDKDKTGTQGSAEENLHDNVWSSCQIFWSSQSGRAKSCARRISRMLGEETSVEIRGKVASFDAAPFCDVVASTSSNSEDSKSSLLILFVSTTGDGEHCSSIQETWKQLLHRSVQKSKFEGRNFALFCLGDRAYGPQFCAAGRKLAVRLLQLGMKSVCEVGYGDDNTPNGGVFMDCDVWFESKLLPILPRKTSIARKPSDGTSPSQVPESPYTIAIKPETSSNEEKDLTRFEWQQSYYHESYMKYFAESSPSSAYVYKSNYSRTNDSESSTTNRQPLVGTIELNERITSDDWEQNTRNIRIRFTSTTFETTTTTTVASKKQTRVHGENEFLPYDAGDVAAVMPFNNTKDVIRFLHVLPPAIADEADSLLDVQMDDFFTGRDFPSWPKRCTLRGWLTVCADIHALPDREDLRALSVYCSHDHPLGKEQSEKLRSLCETSESALYADYILREKRTWVDVFFDFESLRAPGTKLTIGSLFQLLPAIRPREYSIASSPSTPAFEDEQKKIDLDPENQSDTRNESFAIELCVGTVEGTTKRGRKFHGLCSYFLSTALPSQPVIVWIRPGSFGKLPLGLAGEDPIASFSVPVIYIGAGTGIAPMRSLLLRRMAVSTSKLKDATAHDIPSDLSDENILVFGCRRKDCDFYYEDQFVTLAEQKRIRLMTAFSRDQFQKIYVQHIVRDADDGKLIAAHILDRNGAVYIAGAPRMAHAVKDELVEALVARLGNKKLAYGKINKMRQEGKFAIEAWS